VTNVHPSGDHDWVVGEVVAIHHRADAYDERFLLKGEHVRPAVFYGRSIFEAFGNGERAQHLPPKART
jgi:flavin reductase (DIM6/NTAB) family NADH-FMN oxidoreductase RutF